MSSDMLTRCPHCKAAFKVSEEQLGIAKGKVRCGACMNVFDALAYAINNDGTSESAPVSSAPSTTQQPSDPTKNSDDLIQDDPEQDQQSQGYKPSSSFGDELSTSFKELDDTGTVDHFSEGLSDTLHEAPDDESWATTMLEEEALSEKASKRKEPSFISEPSSTSQQSSNQTSQDFSVNEHAVEHSASISADQDGYPFDDFLNEQDKRRGSQNKSESISFYYNTDDDKPKRHWIVSTLFVLFNSALVISLVILASWFHYEKLAKYPVMADIYSKACEIAGCTLPELKDLEKIRSRNLVVRSHPTQRDALIIDAVVINEAGFEQNFPSLAIYFSDINNQTIAQRLIMPEQYLSEEALGWGKMPADQPIHISLEIVDPGKEAVNYSVKFFPTESNNTVL